MWGPSSFFVCVSLYFCSRERPITSLTRYLNPSDLVWSHVATLSTGLYVPAEGFHMHAAERQSRWRLRARFPSLPSDRRAEISAKKACNWQSHVLPLRERAQPARERMRAKEGERERGGEGEQYRGGVRKGLKGRERDMTKISKGRKHAVPCELNWWPMGSRMSD